jgi:hypothetical protein
LLETPRRQDSHEGVGLRTDTEHVFAFTDATRWKARPVFKGSPAERGGTTLRYRQGTDSGFVEGITIN